MIHGVDYNETFAPVAKIVTMRIFLTLVVMYNLFTGSLDVKTAFLNASLSDVDMEPPSNLLHLLSVLLVDPETTADQQRRILKHIKHLKSGEKLKLLKTFYGTRQAGREWYILFYSFLKELGFKPNRADHSFYTLAISATEYVCIIIIIC